ncbi:MAG: flagellar hook protein FlgE [Alphaproteobacteria bacterium]|nr:flagellar hook protein FlgE [Alphaproteobacteria bacterium]|tara:strand:+ start:4730 stop:4939 length:210 start_codon:yes stop_codon:yes gene_type:complete
MQAFAIAAGGIAAATARFDASARRTAAAPLDNLETEIVDRLESEVALKANVAVLKTADDMTGTLLDMLA